jgi:hypothetical protein
MDRVLERRVQYSAIKLAEADVVNLYQHTPSSLASTYPAAQNVNKKTLIQQHRTRFNIAAFNADDSESEDDDYDI